MSKPISCKKNEYHYFCLRHHRLLKQFDHQVSTKLVTRTRCQPDSCWARRRRLDVISLLSILHKVAAVTPVELLNIISSCCLGKVSFKTSNAYRIYNRVFEISSECGTPCRWKKQWNSGKPTTSKKLLRPLKLNWQVFARLLIKWILWCSPSSHASKLHNWSKHFYLKKLLVLKITINYIN